jgi:hypothetical protein
MNGSTLQFLVMGFGVLIVSAASLSAINYELAQNTVGLK